MLKDWEIHWEDYYKILQVDPSAESEVIKAIYRKLASKYHPDVNKDPSAEEKMKKINLAYEVLSNPEKRKMYHTAWLHKKGIAGAWTETSILPKPKPVIAPQYIKFDNVRPGEIQTASFIIQNIGGPYTKKIRINVSNPDSWVRIVSYSSLTNADELPLRVEIKAEGKDWNKSYSEIIRVRLDEEEAQVRIELQTKLEQVREKIPVSAHRGFPTWGKWMMGFGCIVVLIIGGIAIFREKEVKEVIGITNFQVSSKNGYLIASFNLVDAENKPMTADGAGQLRFYDGMGQEIYRETFKFSKQNFLDSVDKSLTPRISKKELKWVLHEGKYAWKHAQHMSVGHARLSITTDNWETYLSTNDLAVSYYSEAEAQRVFKELFAHRFGKIVFVSNRDGNNEVYIMNIDGSNQVNLTNNPASDSAPRWSPDGKRIAFVSDRDGNNEIYVMKADGTNQVNLTNNSANDWYPYWSPDGKRIAFVSDRDGNNEIYVMRADGNSQTRLTNESAPEKYPVWSPDGNKIVFISERDNVWGDIFIMNVDGTQIKKIQIFTAPIKETLHDWSTDGHYLTLTARWPLVNHELKLIEMKNRWSVSQLKEDTWGGSFSPNSIRLVITYMPHRERDWEIGILDISTGGITTRLTNNDADDWDSDWSP